MEQPRRKPGPATAFNRRVSLYESDEGLALLNQLAEQRGVSQAALLRILIREEARRQGVTVPEEK